MEIERGLVRTGAGYLHYRAAGQGRPVLLCHVNQQSSALWLEMMAVLAPRVRAIAVDYPSHGHSDHVAAQPTIQDYATWIVELADALGLGGFDVLGEAVGAAVSIELAAARPDRVGRAVLLNCPSDRARAAVAQAHDPLKQGLRPADPTGFPLPRTIGFLLERDPGHAPMRPTQSWMDRINVAQLEAGRDRWQALDALAAYDVRAALPRIACPVLLLLGEHFHYAHLKDEFAAGLRHGTVEIVPGARFCMGWERAEEIGRRALAFLGAGS